MTTEEGEKFAERMGTLFVGASAILTRLSYLFALTHRVLSQDQRWRNRGVPGAR